jgi:Histidine phosphatase superfamily (branch 2)
MADCVVPQEYGTTIAEKRSVGVKICHGLLEKIKYDLSVARTDNEVDMRYMINMAYSADLPINTMGRRIRTRLYFTSESHLHTVLSVFRFAQCEQDANSSNISGKRRKRHKHPLLSERGMSIINGTPELCYLTQIVMRVFEDNRRSMDDPCRFRVEILFSPGATATPRVMNEKEREQDTSRLDTAPLQVIGRDGLTCQEVEDFFEQAIMAGRTDDDIPYDVTSTVAFPESPPQHQAAMPSKDIAAKADDAQEQQDASALATGAETGSDKAVRNDSDKPPGKEEASTEQDNHGGKNDDATSEADENASTLTMSNRASMGRALLKERMELDTKSEASAAEAKEANDVSQTRLVDLGKNDGEDSKNHEEKTEDSTSSNDELSTTRKYFWGTVAVASFGLGAACLVIALTFPRDRRGGYRRWSTTRGRY